MTIEWEHVVLAALFGWIAVNAINKMRRGLSRIAETSPPTPQPRSGDERGEEERLWDRLVENGGCLACDITPKGFAEGPSGGMNTNVFCIRCGQGYNIAPMLNWAQEIGKNERYVAKEAEHGKG